MSAAPFLDRVFSNIPSVGGKFSFNSWRHAGRPTSEGVGVLPADPFQSLDQEGIGSLVRLAVEKGRGVRPGLKLGICGEHGGDPDSVEFCHSVGLDYVSCSPYRVPVARLAAARAAILARRAAG